jgi:hypothetical protein
MSRHSSWPPRSSAPPPKRHKEPPAPVIQHPNPGSEAARDAGCICPAFDNNFGLRPPRPPDSWWKRPDCRLHGIGYQ